MDILHEQGVKLILFLQNHAMTDMEFVNVFVQLPQYLADPDTLMIYVFPLLLIMNRWLACRFALTIGVVDMINTVLKWILQGERPYWWVRETNQTMSDLQHHPLTCETGPGSPSGHAMTSAAIGFVFISAVIDEFLHHEEKNHWKKRFMEHLLWIFYIFMVVFISVARLRLATHFPHQVLLGAFAGLIGGWLVWNLPIERFQRTHFIGFAAALFLWALVTYFGLQFFGIDPNRTVQLALKHCADRGYVKMSTTPWHSVYRNAALILSCGFCATSQLWTEIITKIKLNLKDQICIGFLSFAVAQILASIPYPHQPTYIFYPCALMKNIAIVTTCLLIIPLISLYENRSISIQETSAVRARKLTASTIRKG